MCAEGVVSRHSKKNSWYFFKKTHLQQTESLQSYFESKFLRFFRFKRTFWHRPVSAHCGRGEELKSSVIVDSIVLNILYLLLPSRWKREGRRKCLTKSGPSQEVEGIDRMPSPQNLYTRRIYIKSTLESEEPQLPMKFKKYAKRFLQS